jgi:hypothetical protein
MTRSLTWIRQETYIVIRNWNFTIYVSLINARRTNSVWNIFMCTSFLHRPIKKTMCRCFLIAA